MLTLQPTLEGANLILRPLEEQDHSALFSIAADPLLWVQHPDSSRATREGFDRFFLAALQSHGCLVAVDKHGNAVIGCSRYHSYEAGVRLTIGYTFLSTAYWGGAANGEMKRLMLQHAFSDVGEVLFLIAEGNTRSRRAVGKLGAELAGAEDGLRFGQVHLRYRLTPEAWAKASGEHYASGAVTRLGSTK